MNGMMNKLSLAPPITIQSREFIEISIMSIEIKLIPIAVLNASINCICLVSINVSKRILVISPLIIARDIIITFAISKDENISEKEINKVVEEMKKIAKKLDLISMTKTKKNTTINFDLLITNFNQLNSLVAKIESKNFKVIVSRNDINYI